MEKIREKVHTTADAALFLCFQELNGCLSKGVIRLPLLHYDVPFAGYGEMLCTQSWEGLNCTLLVWARFPEKALTWCGPNLFVADKKTGASSLRTPLLWIAYGC